MLSPRISRCKRLQVRRSSVVHTQAFASAVSRDCITRRHAGDCLVYDAVCDRSQLQATIAAVVGRWYSVEFGRRSRWTIGVIGDNWWIVHLCHGDEQRRYMPRIPHARLGVWGFLGISRSWRGWCGISGRVGGGEIKVSWYQLVEFVSFRSP